LSLFGYTSGLGPSKLQRLFAKNRADMRGDRELYVVEGDRD
jgi:hypothetical protein